MLDFLDKYDSSVTIGQLSVVDFTGLMLFIVLLAVFVVLSMEGVFSQLISFISYHFAKSRAFFRKNRLLLESEGYPTVFLSVGYFAVFILVITVLLTIWITV